MYLLCFLLCRWLRYRGVQHDIFISQQWKMIFIFLIQFFIIFKNVFKTSFIPFMTLKWFTVHIPSVSALYVYNIFNFYYLYERSRCKVSMLLIYYFSMLIYNFLWFFLFYYCVFFYYFSLSFFMFARRLW